MLRKRNIGEYSNRLNNIKNTPEIIICVIHGRDSLSKGSMPASAQSTTSGEEDSVSVICKVRCDVEGVSSGALVDASNKSSGAQARCQ
jgi:hypothetical protein